MRSCSMRKRIPVFSLYFVRQDFQQKGGFFDPATLFESRSCTDVSLHSLLVDIVLAHMVCLHLACQCDSDGKVLCTIYTRNLDP